MRLPKMNLNIGLQGWPLSSSSRAVAPWIMPWWASTMVPWSSGAVSFVLYRPGPRFAGDSLATDQSWESTDTYGDPGTTAVAPICAVAPRGT